MLNRILEFEKKTLKDKVHMGISIGKPFIDPNGIKQRYATINAKINDDLHENFDYKYAKYMINPGVYPLKPVKKIYADIHKKILNDIEEDGMSKGFILGPKKAPGQIMRINDYRDGISNLLFDSETNDHSLMTNGMGQYDNNHTHRLLNEDDGTPKKLLKKTGK